MMLQATTIAAAVAEKALQTSSTCTTAVLEVGGGRAAPTAGSRGQPMLEEEQAGCPPAADIPAAFSRLPAAIGRLTAAFGRLTMVPLIISKAATDKAPSGAAAHRRGQLLLKHDPPSRRASFPAPKWDPMLEVARLAGRVQSSSIGGGERLKLLEVCGPPWGVNLGVNQVLQSGCETVSAGRAYLFRRCGCWVYRGNAGWVAGRDQCVALEQVGGPRSS